MLAPFSLSKNWLIAFAHGVLETGQRILSMMRNSRTRLASAVTPMELSPFRSLRKWPSGLQGFPAGNRSTGSHVAVTPPHFSGEQVRQSLHRSGLTLFHPSARSVAWLTANYGMVTSKHSTQMAVQRHTFFTVCTAEGALVTQIVIERTRQLCSHARLAAPSSELQYSCALLSRTECVTYGPLPASATPATLPDTASGRRSRRSRRRTARSETSSGPVACARARWSVRPK